MIERFKVAWFGRGDMSPKFKPCGLALQNVQFAYRNVVGRGQSNKLRAAISWFGVLLSFIFAPKPNKHIGEDNG